MEARIVKRIKSGAAFLHSYLTYECKRGITEIKQMIEIEIKIQGKRKQKNVFCDVKFH